MSKGKMLVKGFYHFVELDNLTIVLKPISFKIVGRKTGREEKETLQEKYIMAVK